MFIRWFNKNDSTIVDTIPLKNIEENFKELLTIRLIVDNSLEPKWTVVNKRIQDNKDISAADRSNLNCFMVSDYVDRHFSWSKGNPLYTLLNSSELEEVTDNNNVILKCLREAKNKIDSHSFDMLNKITEQVLEQAATFGLDLSATSTTLDVKELITKDGRLSLHDEVVPFRLKGKGSRRLASFAIQAALVKDGGIMLLDEIEQGLEPDRVKQVIRTLKNEDKTGQIFLTTHSRDAIIELEVKDIILLVKEKNTSRIESKNLSDLSMSSLQATIRACPEAFFAKKVIVCEGATEIGICRALDNWRLKNNEQQISFKDCAYIDGTGSALINRALEINNVGIKTSLFCDSDKIETNDKKENCRSSGIAIYDCDEKFCLEEQVFKDLPWAGIKQLIEYILKTRSKGEESTLKQSIKSQYGNESIPENWLELDTPKMRTALAKTSILENQAWFKRIDHGKFLGDVIFQHIAQMDDAAHLKKTLISLSNWIDN